jgi:hypothetical protein
MWRPDGHCVDLSEKREPRGVLFEAKLTFLLLRHRRFLGAGLQRWGLRGGKSHFAAALGFVLVENAWRALFTRTTDLVQRLQIARRELALEAAIAKLNTYHRLIAQSAAALRRSPGWDRQRRGSSWPLGSA